MFSLIYIWINGCVNNREAGDLRRHRGHHGVNVMSWDENTFPRWTVEVWEWIINFIPRFNWACDSLHMLGSKSIRVSKVGPWSAKMYLQLFTAKETFENTCILVSTVYHVVLNLNVVSVSASNASTHDKPINLTIFSFQFAKIFTWTSSDSIRCGDRWYCRVILCYFPYTR